MFLILISVYLCLLLRKKGDQEPTQDCCMCNVGQYLHHLSFLITREILILVPAFSAMATMSSWTIVFLFESSFLFTTEGIMIILRIRIPLTRFRVVVRSAIFLSTRPAPCFAAPLSFVKFTIIIKAASKYVCTCCIFQTPTLAPGTLFCILGSRFHHSVFQKGISKQF